MSYDLVVFDPIQAPTEHSKFLHWYEQQSEESYDPSELAGQELGLFFDQLSREFPPLNGPDSDIDNSKLTDYVFGPCSIYMSFPWSQAVEAHQAVVKLIQIYSVGFYDISDPNGFVWWPPRPDQFGVFYCFHGNNEMIASDLPLSMDLDEVVSRLLPKLISDSDFLGIVNSNGVTLQFMYHKAGNRFWMEIPVPEKRGSYGSYLSPAELHARVESLPSGFSISTFPELQFQSWDE